MKELPIMHLLLYMLSFLLTASAVHVPIYPRMDPYLQHVEELEMDYLDAPTSDGSAGIGTEFETPWFYFINNNCSLDDTNAAKKHVVAGRKGTNFQLTADTGNGAGKLTAEYILDGQNIKVGSGDAAKAGKAASNDLMGWKPWTGNRPVTVDIENNKCNPWTIGGPRKDFDPANLEWGPQVTAPMPLEALYSLMKEQVLGLQKRNILNGMTYEHKKYPILVTQEYFQSNTNGIDGTKVTDDMLAFCSLVLSYAKAASDALRANQSPKSRLSFMPRTEFNTIFQQVKSKIPGDLFTLFNSLACYTHDSNSGKVVVDTAYCSGNASKPTSNNKFGGLTYTNPGANPPAAVNIKSWIQGIGSSSPSPDELSAFDVTIDGSIGGLGTKMEKMYNSQRSVPLFEFRNLNTILTPGFEGFMTKVDLAIQDLHKTYANAPQRKKRQAGGSCVFKSSTTSSPTTKPSCHVQDEDPGLGITTQGCICLGSSTWPVLSTKSGADQSALCDYTAAPAPTTAIITEAPAKATTLSQACKVCTPLPNYEGKCSSIPNCKPQTAYATATVNSSPVHYGTLSQDALYTGVSTALSAACSSVTSGTTTISGKATPTVACDSKKDYTISNEIPFTQGGVLEETGTLSINIGSYAANAKQLQALLAVAASIVTKAVSSSQKNCYTMEYQEPLDKRDHPVPISSSMQVCNGPAVVVASYWAPGYQDRISNGQAPAPDAQITATIKFSSGTSGNFFCELAAAVAGAILTEIAPELEELDILSAEQLEAQCQSGDSK